VERQDWRPHCVLEKEASVGQGVAVVLPSASPPQTLTLRAAIGAECLDHPPDTAMMLDTLLPVPVPAPKHGAWA
jgi:hypothetical protein